jgi:hypothetical protein
MVEPAANIENWGDCRVTEYLDRQHVAFHGANPELGSAMFGDPRSAVASAFARRTTKIIRMTATCRRAGRSAARYITPVVRNACRRSDIHRRNIADQHRLMRRLLAISNAKLWY